MENFDIYKDIAERTQGDIYVGVVGPVRTGKSSFIKRFMDLMVIPNIDNAFKKERAKDELPQSGSGKSIHTMEPKFVPNEAVNINVGDNVNFKVRMVDCVGYIVKGAIGYNDGEESKKVMTPWFDYEIPFEDAAEIGTRKVINDHSTIGLVVTTDGSITSIPREDYEEAEERVVDELKAIEKPFVMVLNTVHKDDPETISLREELEEKYDVPIIIVDVLNMNEGDIAGIFKRVLNEFPIKELNLDMPEWIETLDIKHWLKESILNIVKDMSKEITRVRDIRKTINSFEGIDFLETTLIDDVCMGEGVARVTLVPKKETFYKVISENCGCDIKSESGLLRILSTFYTAKKEYDKIEKALEDVRETGYGMVAPQLTEMKFEEPEKVKQGSGYAVKLKASAPSFHFIRADIQTEISPIIGSEKETEDVIMSLLEQFDGDMSKIWESQIFGKSLEILVKEGLQNKLYKMPEDVQHKIQRALEKIINEGNADLICILL